MNLSHTSALQSFNRRLLRLLVLRGAVQWMTLWFFVWGVVVLVARFVGVTRGSEWLLLGLLGFVPLVLIAAWLALRRPPEFARVRASYDNTNACGGVLMSEEAADMTAWEKLLPEAHIPDIRWQSARFLLLLFVSAAFVATGLLLPDRLTRLTTKHSLEVGQLVQELKVEVQALEEEKILDEKKAEDMQQQLSQLQKDASALDPNKTWEALDHIKESDLNAAEQATEEALQKLEKMSQAETLAAAMQQAAEQGMTADTATQAAQDLASMIKSAKLEEGILNGAIPPELLADLSGLNKEQMEQLMKALQANKNSLNKTVSKLAGLKLIDPSKLGQCKSAGQCKNPGALADYLSSCTNGGSCDLLAILSCYGRGGVDRGRGDAPMTWQDESSADGAKFKEEVLPAATQLSDAQLVGLSRSAPELTGDDITADHGALASAAAGGGAAHSQAVLPRHKQAVQNYFKREN